MREPPPCCMAMDPSRTSKMYNKPAEIDTQPPNHAAGEVSGETYISCTHPRALKPVPSPTEDLTDHIPSRNQDDAQNVGQVHTLTGLALYGCRRLQIYLTPSTIDQFAEESRALCPRRPCTEEAIDPCKLKDAYHPLPARSLPGVPHSPQDTPSAVSRPQIPMNKT